MVKLPPTKPGDRHGLLTVLSFQDKLGYATRWNCLCDCGTLTISLANNLRRGIAKSCGCVRTTNGYSKHPLYFVWANMLDRCKNPRNTYYKQYGERGITVSEDWSSFKKFIEDMGARPSPKYQLDRRENNLGYNKENCRWVTARVNLNNRSNTRMVTYKGVQMPISDAADLAGIPAATLHKRLAVSAEELFRPRYSQRTKD